MPQVSMGLTAPKFRHFWPVCPVFTDPVHFTPPVLAPKTVLVLDMRKYLLQGANPIDTAIISKADDNVTPQFQGGYRCTLKLSLNADHGDVNVSQDGQSFEYVAKAGYVGSDSFAYQIVNVMGQPSAEYGYIQLLIRC